MKGDNKQKKVAESKAPVVSEKSKAIKKAKKSAGKSRRTDQKRRHRTHLKTRFYRPKTFRQNRTPKYVRSFRAALKNKNIFDRFAVIKNPSSTEKAMKKMEEENTMVFIVDQQATKAQIKEAFQKLYQVKVRKVNTMIR
jgi:large subunit ribosomal protein L23Ae